MEDQDGPVSKPPQSTVCQRCGRGFVLVSTYYGFLERRGAKEKTPLICATCFRKRGPLPKLRGRIKWFNSRKNYGFAVTDDNQEVYLHQRQILGDQNIEPQQGQTVLFHVHYSPKGPEALNVALV
jgi:CspA family cold shock protein